MLLMFVDLVYLYGWNNVVLILYIMVNKNLGNKISQKFNILEYIQKDRTCFAKVKFDLNE